MLFTTHNPKQGTRGVIEAAVHVSWSILREVILAPVWVRDVVIERGGVSDGLAAATGAGMTRSPGLCSVGRASGPPRSGLGFLIVGFFALACLLLVSF